MRVRCDAAVVTGWGLRGSLCLPALGLLDALVDCVQCHIVLLGDRCVGQPAVDVVGRQLLDTSPLEPHQEAALLEVCPLLGLLAPQPALPPAHVGSPSACSRIWSRPAGSPPFWAYSNPRSLKCCRGFVRAQARSPRGSRPHPDVMHEGRGLLGESWVYSAGCGGSCSTHIPRPAPPEARGVASRNMAGRSPGVVGVPPGESWSRIRVPRGPFTPASTRTTSQASPAGTASTRRDSSAGEGWPTESGTAFGARNLLVLQMTEVVPQSSGGKRSPRRGSTSPIWSGATSVR